LVNKYFEKAANFEKAKQTDSAIVYYNKAIQLSESLKLVCLFCRKNADYFSCIFYVIF